MALSPLSPSSPKSRILTSNSQEFTSLHAKASATDEIILNAKDHPSADKKTQMCIIVMEMLHSILCEPENVDLVAKFANTITNKWALLFFEKNTHPYIVVLALRILCRLLVTQGQTYLLKFRVGSDGMLVMQNLLRYHWNVFQVHEALIATLLGIDVADIPIQASADLSRIITLHTQNAHRQIAIPEIFRVELALIDDGMREQKNSDLSGKLTKFICGQAHVFRHD